MRPFLAGLLGVLSLALLGANGRVVQAQTLPTIAAALAAPGTAARCLPPTDRFFTPLSAGATGVLFRGSGFQPGERVALGYIGRSATPPQGLPPAHDVLPIGDAIADASGRFGCFTSLSLGSIGTPFYVQFGAFSASTVAFEGTEQLPMATLAVPAMPPTGTGSGVRAWDSNSEVPVLLAAVVLVGLAAGAWRMGKREETRGEDRYRL